MAKAVLGKIKGRFITPGISIYVIITLDARIVDLQNINYLNVILYSLSPVTITRALRTLKEFGEMSASYFREQYFGMRSGTLPTGSNRNMLPVNFPILVVSFYSVC